MADEEELLERVMRQRRTGDTRRRLSEATQLAFGRDLNAVINQRFEEEPHRANVTLIFNTYTEAQNAAVLMASMWPDLRRDGLVVRGPDGRFINCIAGQANASVLSPMRGLDNSVLLADLHYLDRIITTALDARGGGGDRDAPSMDNPQIFTDTVRENTGAHMATATDGVPTVETGGGAPWISEALERMGEEVQAAATDPTISRVSRRAGFSVEGFTSMREQLATALHSRPVGRADAGVGPSGGVRVMTDYSDYLDVGRRAGPGPYPPSPGPFTHLSRDLREPADSVQDRFARLLDGPI